MNTLKIEKIVSEVSLMNALETIHNNCESHNVTFAINEVINYCQKFRNYSELNHDNENFFERNQYGQREKDYCDNDEY